MSDDRLFEAMDETEATYVGDTRPEKQPTEPPLMPTPALEHGLLTTPPYRGDKDGLRTEPIDQGALGETAREEARMRDATNTDAG